MLNDDNFAKKHFHICTFTDIAASAKWRGIKTQKPHKKNAEVHVVQEGLHAPRSSLKKQANKNNKQKNRQTNQPTNQQTNKQKATNQPTNQPPTNQQTNKQTNNQTNTQHMSKELWTRPFEQDPSALKSRWSKGSFQKVKSQTH